MFNIRLVTQKYFVFELFTKLPLACMGKIIFRKLTNKKLQPWPGMYVLLMRNNPAIVISLRNQYFDHQVNTRSLYHCIDATRRGGSYFSSLMTLGEAEYYLISNL